MWDRLMRWAVLAVATLGFGCARGLQDRDLVRLPAASQDRAALRYSGQVLSDFDEALGLAYQLKYGEAEAKLSHLLGIFEAAKDVQRASKTIFWLGYCNEKQRRSGRAKEFYQRVVGEYPRSRAAHTAGQRLRLLE